MDAREAQRLMPKGCVAATIAGDDSEFWLCQVQGWRAGRVQVRWFERTATVRPRKYELGLPQEGGLRPDELLCLVRKRWDGAGDLVLAPEEAALVTAALPTDLGR